jgi:hypothetical protein
VAGSELPCRASNLGDWWPPGTILCREIRTMWSLGLKVAWFPSIGVLRNQFTKVRVSRGGTDGEFLDCTSNVLTCQRCGFSSDANVKEVESCDYWR